MHNEPAAWSLVDRHAEDLIGLSDRVWATPELCYAEFASAAEHTAMLQAKGFRVTEDLAGMPTAMMGEAGEGGPIIAFLGEYDALPGLSQEAGLAEPRALPGNGNGHGCGHNLLGAAALLAACALKDWLEETGTPGRVRYYGCPAEEGGAAKGFMVRAGVFDDVAAAITWHPGAFNQVMPARALASTRVEYLFEGRSSHAAASPHLGRSALDATQLMCTGVQYLREHIPQKSRIHYAYIDAGGVAPNVVQASAGLRFSVRAPDLAGMADLLRRVQLIAEGAAMMTETKVTTHVRGALSNLVPNLPLERAMQDNWDRMGPPPFDAEDHAWAASIQATLTEQEIDSAWARAGLPREPGKALCDFVVPFGTEGARTVGSTDVGDVSWVVPTVQANAATIAIGTPGHSWQVTAQGRSPAAHKAMVQVARVMAGTAIDCLADPALLAAAQADFDARMARGAYVCPIPPEVEPALVARP